MARSSSWRLWFQSKIFHLQKFLGWLKNCKTTFSVFSIRCSWLLLCSCLFHSGKYSRKSFETLQSCDWIFYFQIRWKNSGLRLDGRKHSNLYIWICLSVCSWKKWTLQIPWIRCLSIHINNDGSSFHLFWWSFSIWCKILIK